MKKKSVNVGKVKGETPRKIFYFSKNEAPNEIESATPERVFFADAPLKGLSISFSLALRMLLGRYRASLSLFSRCENLLVLTHSEPGKTDRREKKYNTPRN